MKPEYYIFGWQGRASFHWSVASTMGSNFKAAWHFYEMAMTGRPHSYLFDDAGQYYDLSNSR